MQNFNVCKKIGTYCTDVSIRLLVPGKEPDGRMADQIIVGTPGKIAQMWSQKKYLKFKAMKVLVFDEADNMMDGGFRDTSIRLVKEVKKAAKGCQILLLVSWPGTGTSRRLDRDPPLPLHAFPPRHVCSRSPSAPDRNRLRVEVARALTLGDRRAGDGPRGGAGCRARRCSWRSTRP